MQKTSIFSLEGVNYTSVGLAFAGSALFVLCFRLIVDTPNTAISAPELTAVSSTVRPFVDSFRNVGSRVQDHIIHP